MSDADQTRPDETNSQPQMGANRQQLASMRMGAMLARQQLGQAAGSGGQAGFQGNRDIYSTLGYTPHGDISIVDYWERYLRQELARAIVDKPAKTTWRERPEITDDDKDEDETSFESDVRALFEDHDLLEIMTDADRLTGIGRYGILVIGVADGGDLSDPVATERLTGTEDLTYLMPFDESRVKQIETVDDPQSERFGQPGRYQVDFDQGTGVSAVKSSSMTKWVHHDRVIHIAEDTLTGKLVGRPRLEPVWNRLTDMAKVIGASAEMAWRGADYGLLLQADPDAAAQMGDDTMEQMEDEAMAYYHGLQPFLRMAGMEKVERLGGEIADPDGIASWILKLISGQTNIPQRILTGSERGELASTQDRATFLGHISERQEHFAEPAMLRPFLDRLLGWGVLSPPLTEDDDATGTKYDVNWPDLFELSEMEKAEVSHKKAQAMDLAAKALMKAQIATVGELRQEVFNWGVEVGSETGETNDLDIDVDPLPGGGGDSADDGADSDPGAPDDADPEREGDGEQDTPGGVQAALDGIAGVARTDGGDDQS